MNRRCARRRSPRQGGLTTIELVVALAATGLMLALAVSAVGTYAIRAQVAESVALAAPLQYEVAREFRAVGMPPADGRAVGQPAGGRPGGTYLDNIDIIDGRIELRFGRAAHAAIAGRVLSLTPFETVDRQVVWLCGNDVPGVGLRPLGFWGGSRQAVQAPTTIEARYLPRACR